MRSHLLATLVFATPLAFAAELILPLTPETLPYWSLSGAKHADFSTEPLTLPPGVQISRVFTTDHAAIRIETSPTFALDPEDWAVLELGPAALVFARDAGTGYLALAVGATEVILHPHTIPLNDEGRASEPVSATLLWQGRRVSLDLGGQRIELEASVPEELAVSASSGLHTPWALERLAVVLPVSDEDLPPGVRNAGDDEAAARASGLVEHRSAADSGDTASAAVETSDSARNAKAPPPGYRPLEVYTPPSVRTQRAAQIEAAVKALRRP
jgi:hypothetical protein